MRNQLVAAVALTVITAGAACARTEPPRRPAIPESATAATAADTPATDMERMRSYAAEVNRDPVPQTLRGFEGQALPPPDPVGGGPAADSDVGEPKWRNSPGTFSEEPATGPAKPSQPEPAEKNR